MLLLRDQVGIQMPGNKRYINTYISEIWPIVVGLTSGIERFEAADWLADHFTEYIDAQEAALRSRLEKIQYDIDSSDTVNEILRSEPIERVWIDVYSHALIAHSTFSQFLSFLPLFCAAMSPRCICVLPQK
jgi:hypothetical protein